MAICSKLKPRSAGTASARSAEISSNSALLHGSDCACIERARRLNSGGADALRASKLKHAVQGMSGDGDLRRATAVSP